MRIRSQLSLQVIVPIVLTGTFLVTVGLMLARYERSYTESVQRQHFHEAIHFFETNLDKVEFVLQGARSLYLSSAEVTADEFGKYFDGLYASLPEIVAIRLIGPDGTIDAVYPATGLEASRVGQSFASDKGQTDLLKSSRLTRTLVADDPVPLPNGFVGVDFFQAIYKDDAYLGTAVATVKMPELMAGMGESLDESSLTGIFVIDDFLLPVDGLTLYTREGERIISPTGITVSELGAPDILSYDQGLEQRIFVGDKEWRLRVRQERDDTITLTMLYTIYALALFLLVVIFLVLLYRGRVRLQKTTAREREFVSLVSHQLRLPLTQVAWGLESALGEKRLPKDARKVLAETYGIAARSAKLVSDILNVSRIDRGVLKLNTETVLVSELIEETIAPLQLAADEAGVRLDVVCPKGLSVCCDRIKAAEAMRNIVDNAIRYSREKRTPVAIEASLPDDGQVRITISDQGAGIPPDEQASIFEKSGAGSGKGVSEGAGLGLFLSKNFIELNGGELTFETSTEGTTFIVKLPSVCAA